MPTDADGTHDASPHRIADDQANDMAISGGPVVDETGTVVGIAAPKAPAKSGVEIASLLQKGTVGIECWR